MNIDNAKSQAKALVTSLAAANVATLAMPQALDIVGQMYGYKNWQTALGAQMVGSWNALQVAIHLAYPNEDLLGLEVGQDLSDYTGDSLFVAIMTEAGEQPATRVNKALESWANVIADLLLTAQGHVLKGDAVEPADLAIPSTLPDALQQFLRAEIHDEDEDLSLSDAIGRLQNVYRDIAAARNSVRRYLSGAPSLILNSMDDAGRETFVVVPPTMTLADAQQLIDEVNTEAEFGDEADARASVLLDYEGHSIKQRLANVGLIPLNVVS